MWVMLTSWRSIPELSFSRRPIPARALAAVIVPCLFAGLFWWLGHARIAVVLLVLAGIVAVASAASARFRHGIESIIVAIGMWIGRVSTVVILGGVYLLIFAPTALFSRLIRRDLLDDGPKTSVSTFWSHRANASDPIPQHMFSVERRLAGGDHRPISRGRRIVRLAAFAMVTIAVLGVADLAVGLAWDGLRGGNGAAAQVADFRSSLPAHDGDDWADSYYGTLRSVPADYEPFVGFRRQDIQSEYLNISDGLRASYEPVSVQQDALPIVYFFGGSTMFGTSQRDDFTIPSFVSRMAEADGIPVEVRNYGHGSYRSRQEVILLELLLVDGARPGVVVFYDGVNDMQQQALSMSDEPSHSQAKTLQSLVDRNRAQADNGWTGVSSGVRRIAAVAKRRSALLRLAKSVRHRFSSDSPAATVGKQEPFDLVPQRAENAASIYMKSVDTAQRLAASYGFDIAFFWQPNIFTKDIAGGEEMLVDPKSCRHCTWDLEDNRSLYLTTTERVGPPVIDITDALDGFDAPVMTDLVHTNELGAEAVAEDIYLNIKPMIVDAYRERNE